MIKRLYWIGLTFCFAAAAFLPATSAETFPEVMFILDGSGSMKGDAGGQTKTEAARKVFALVVPKLPSEVRLGLAAYGHRRSKDCRDVDILVSPGSSDRDLILQKVMSIQPTGMTPIALAVTQVINLLKGRDTETTIVLVSDGKETCGGDPCAVVRALKDSGINFIMHVVGFDVTDEEKKQLTCIAEAGGGQYFGATDADSLLAALEKVRKDIAEKVEKAKTSVVKRTTKLGKLRLQLPKSSLISLRGFKITRKRDGKTIKDAEIKGQDTVHPLMVDDYSLTLSFANANYRPPTDVDIASFKVTGGETTSLSLGAIVFNIADGLVDANIDAVNVLRKGDAEPMLTIKPFENDYYLFKPKPLPEGEYDIALQYSRSPKATVVATNITVKSGKEAVVTLDSGIVLKRPEAAGVTGWDLVPSGTDKPVISVKRRWDNEEPLWRRFIVPPGTYDLYLNLKGMDEPLPAGEGVEIKKGQTLLFDSGM